MVDEIQPLDQSIPIVTSEGLATPYFTQWAQQRQLAVGDSIVVWSAGRSITAGIGLAGGGTLDANVVIDLAARLDDLLDVDTTTNPPVVGDGLVFDGTDWVPGFPQLPQYTVAGLPAAGTVGRMAAVTDAAAPAYLAVVAGGGAVKVPVYDNGAAWVCV